MGEKITYDTFFTRSFSRSDQKKLGYAAFLGCLLITFSFCLVFKPYSVPQSVRFSTTAPKRMNLICKSETRSDFCEIHEEDIRIDAKSSTVYISASSQESVPELEENSSMIIRPYARKEDQHAMRSVRKWSVKPLVGTSITSAIPRCNQSHNVPAILFSLGAYSGNNYHDFTDIIIPLYSTARLFNGEVKFLVTNGNPWWINKFRNLVRKLSNYEVINIDKEENIHCFTTIIVGLKRAPRELSIDASKSPYSMKDFRQFLRTAYSLNKVTATKIENKDDDEEKTRPRLLVVARNRTRAFRNTDEIVTIARNLGYEVVVGEADGNIQRFAEIVNSCDVMMGVHGAGLTNMVFLPENAVLIQIIPIGGVKWPARVAFGEPSKDMNIRYLEYEIKTEESSLTQQYPAGHEVLNNPSSISKQGWLKFKALYLDKQDVNLDINRFKSTLLRALELLHE